MVSVFIAHHPDDIAAAADLAARLGAKGPATRLGQTAEDAWNQGYASDYIVIMWSETSVASPYIYEIAATENDYRLIHVKLGNIKLSDVPTSVRPDNLIPISNDDLVFKVLSRREIRPIFLYSLRASDAQLDLPGLEAAKKAKAERRAKARQSALKTEAGKLVYRLPDVMTLGAEQVVELRIGHLRALGLASGLMGDGVTVSEDLQIVETMTIELGCVRRAFAIVRHSRPTQLANSKRIQGTDYDGFGRWLWRVTPKKRGTQELHFTISAALLDSQGVPSSAALPPRTFTVRVKVDYVQLSGAMMKSGATGLVATCFAGIVGAFTQDIWWPTLKSWMQTLGVLT